MDIGGWEAEENLTPFLDKKGFFRSRRWRHGESVPEEERLSVSTAGNEGMENSVMDESISKPAAPTTKGGEQFELFVIKRD